MPMSHSRVSPVPAVLRLVQTAVLGRWRATGEDLYREAARLGEAGPGRDVIVAGCGAGTATEWLVLRTGASVTGVDPDPDSIERAEDYARKLAGNLPLHYASAPLDDLPYETGVFDLAIGEPALSAAGDAAVAVAELARVTRPMGTVVLLQPTWTSELAADARDMLVERLGLRPRLLVEWKQLLRDAGVVELQVQDWTDGAQPGRPAPPADAAVPGLSWQDKAQIVGRAWRWSGWRAARGAVAREKKLLEELSHERAIGFQLIRGVKWPHERTS